MTGSFTSVQKRLFVWTAAASFPVVMFMIVANVPVLDRIAKAITRPLGVGLDFLAFWTVLTIPSILLVACMYHRWWSRLIAAAFTPLTTMVPLAALLAFEAFASAPPSKVDERFIAHIQQALPRLGDRATLSRIHPGPWSKVCINRGSEYRAFRRADVEQGYGINAGTLKVNGQTPVFSESNWNVLFFSIDGELEAFNLPHSQVGFAGISAAALPETVCAGRDATFVRTRPRVGQPALTIEFSRIVQEDKS